MCSKVNKEPIYLNASNLDQQCYLKVSLLFLNMKSNGQMKGIHKTNTWGGGENESGEHQVSFIF
jgi:hypothetical protein